MDLSNQEYDALVRSKAKPSPLWKDLAWAFCVGGGICVVGQGLMEWYQSLGLEQEQAGTAVSVTLVLAAALLTGLGLFDKVAKRAGAGTLVPITGFANAMVSPALEFKSEGLITGTAAKLFVVAGAGAGVRHQRQRDLWTDSGSSWTGLRAGCSPIQREKRQPDP